MPYRLPERFVTHVNGLASTIAEYEAETSSKRKMELNVKAFNHACIALTSLDMNLLQDAIYGVFERARQFDSSWPEKFNETEVWGTFLARIEGPMLANAGIDENARRMILSTIEPLRSLTTRFAVAEGGDPRKLSQDAIACVRTLQIQICQEAQLLRTELDDREDKDLAKERAKWLDETLAASLGTINAWTPIPEPAIYATWCAVSATAGFISGRFYRYPRRKAE